jgi:Clp amino terminal domain, pathogenicity island component
LDAKDVPEGSLEQAIRFASSQIMPEHILLALIDAHDSTARRVLAAHTSFRRVCAAS